MKFKKSTEWATGHSSIKNSKACAAGGEGAQQWRINLAEVNPTHKIEPEVCLTLQVDSQIGVSHFTYPSFTVLECARDLGNTIRESLKRISQWSAYITLLTDVRIIRYLRTASPSETFRNVANASEGNV